MKGPEKQAIESSEIAHLSICFLPFSKRGGDIKMVWTHTDFRALPDTFRVLPDTISLRRRNIQTEPGPEAI